MSTARRPGADALLALDRELDRLAADVSRDGSGRGSGHGDGHGDGHGRRDDFLGVDAEPLGADAEDTSGLLGVASRLAVLPESDWDAVAPLYSGTRASRSVPWRVLVAVAAAVVAVAVVVGALFPAVGPGGGRSPRRSPEAAASWRLAGFIGQAAWSTAASAGTVSAQVLLSCPAPGTCYADQPGPVSAAHVVEVTKDGGSTWHASPIPSGLAVTSAPSCPSARTCVVGAVGSATGAVAVLVTVDGGATWVPHPVPVGVLAVTLLACTSPAACVAFGHGPPAGGTPRPPLALRTADAAASWSVESVAGPFIPEVSGGVSCTGPATCVVVGVVPGTPLQGAVRVTTDGGTTWSAGTLPAGVTEVRAVACPGSSSCVAVANEGNGNSISLRSADAGRRWSRGGVLLTGGTTTGTVACTSAADCYVGGRSGVNGIILGTSDGGATWTPAALPSTPLPGSPFTSFDLQDVAALACMPTASCLAVGTVGTAAPSGRQVVLRS